MSGSLLTWIMILLTTLLVIGVPVTALLIFLKQTAGTAHDDDDEVYNPEEVDDEAVDENGDPVLRQRKNAIADEEFDW